MLHWDTGRSAPPRLRLDGRQVPLRRLIAAGAVFALIIIAAVIGHAIAGSDSIAPGDCVVTSPDLADGWSIRKVACTSKPGSGPVVQKVLSVLNGATGQCDPSLTTFRDDPAGKTYCLTGHVPGQI